MSVMRQIQFTKEGFDKLKADYESLLAERPAAVDDLKKARDMGDLSENGYYRAARAKLSSIDGRLRRMSYSIKQAVVVDSVGKDAISIGSTVTLSDGKNETTYQVVGDLEADPVAGKISLLSPIGRAIGGRKVGDEVTISTPSGEISYKIIKISS